MKYLFFIFSICWVTCSLQAQDPCDFVIALPEDINLEPGQSIQIDLLTNVPPEVIQSIVWTPSIGLSCVDCYSPIAEPPADICYYVTVTDTTDCSITDSICFFVGMTNLVDQYDRSQDLTIYPNPANELLFIDLPGLILSEIRIFNTAGKVVQSTLGPLLLSNGIPVAKLPPGVYFLEARNDSYFARRKFLKI